MCFTQPISLILCFVEIACSVVAYKCGNKPEMWMVLYFASMELIQFLQYFVVAPIYDHDLCHTSGNIILTYLGVIHIYWQPFVLRLSDYVSSSKDEKVSKSTVAKLKSFTIMAFIGGVLDMYGLLMLRPGYDWDTCGGGMWLAGNVACTYKGDTHLAWTVPSSTPTYYRSFCCHFFTFFVPYFCIDVKYAIKGVILFISGPLMAEYISGWNRHESPSIWCYMALTNIVLVFGFELAWDYMKKMVKHPSDVVDSSESSNMDVKAKED
eukprot:gnl/Dysnectes_brevis/3841_a4956_1134.p1 GENE.gnl/Dysnectes_brevis/3841_a4956_1134~~gnl/Dysnectes_brevis/3841_a4956_1134.p1  ORF type:complete len:266 (+),score=10.27 gnl/Dysnectes_brevis/3841_a4956_1134:155-952(+)